MVHLRAFAALLGATLVACQGAQLGRTSTIPADVGVGPRATFALATPAGLLGLNAEGRTLGRIVELPVGAAPSAPTLHPDGKRIFFALSQTTQETGFGSDIYSVNVDGTDLRPVVRHDQPNVFYASPSFDGVGNAIYVHRRQAKEDANHPGVYLQSEDFIEHVDVPTGERRTVLSDGAEPTVAPGGNLLVYVHMDRGQQDGLWTASTDGTGARPLLKTGDRFWFLQSPRVSPSGRLIVWSSAGRTSASPRHSAPFAAPASRGPGLAHLDIPSELYVAPLDGTSLRLITTTRDDVVPAWSPDSTRIAYAALSTFAVARVSDGAVITSTQGIGFVYGDPVWLRLP